MSSRGSANGEVAVRVSVLTLTCDRPQFLNRAVESVLAQTFSSWELIVVHDGGADAVASVMRRWTETDPRIRYFPRPEKMGIGNSYNFGLAQARGEYIAILDDDDWWVAPEKLAQQVHFLDTHRDYVACGGGMIVTDTEGRELMRYFKPETDAEIRRRALVANPMAHSTMVFRRAIGAEPVQYDETLGGFHDWNLWLQLARVGRLYNFSTMFTSYTLWPSASFATQRAGVRAAATIVMRHRDSYTGVAFALALVSLQYLYSLLPSAARRRSFVAMSTMKKRLFGRRTQQPPADLQRPARIETGTVRGRS